MKLKMKALVNGRNSLEELCKVKGLDSLVAYKLARNKQSIDNELKAYDEAVKKICDEYGVKNEDGDLQTGDNGSPMFLRKDIGKVNDELGKLLDIDIDVDVKMLKYKDLKKSEMSADDILNLEFMIDFSEDDDKETN